METKVSQSKQLPGYSWATIQVPHEGTPGQPVYDGGIDYVLTQRERTEAAKAAVSLEDQRRQRNNLEAARELGVALEALE